MPQPIIRVENLGKKYTIRHEHPEQNTPEISANRMVIPVLGKKI